MADIPEKIGRYKIQETIGQGAMGIVYKALDPNIDRIVAIKAVHYAEFQNAPDGDELVQRFKREIQTAGLLTHSNIVTIYDGGVDNDIHWIAMEFIDGPSLRKVIEDKFSFSFTELATIMIKICSAMEFAHKRGIVHRDLKPANILMTKDMEPKIADFGIARVESSTMTKTGVILGTPSYMSPEQVTGQRLDHRSDIFSLGIILYELMTGERPFMADNPTTIMYKIVHSDPVSPVEINPTLPKGIAEIVLRSMAKRPDDRYRSAGEMAQALLKLIGSGSELSLGTGRHDLETTALSSSDVVSSFDHYEGAGAPSTTGRAKSGGGGRTALIIFIVLIVIGGVAGGIWFMNQGATTANNNSSGPLPGALEIGKPLSFTTNVEDADVLIDGEKVGIADGKEILVERKEGTVVELRLEKDCFEPVSDSIVINNKQPLNREYTLKRKIRSLEIITDPAGARIAVNGKAAGAAPLEIEIECGLTYTIAADAAGFNTARSEVNWDTVPENQPLNLSLAEVKMGSVEFRGGYAVTVRNDKGTQLGKDLKNLSLRPGSYTVNLSNRDVFLNISASFEVKENGKTSVDLPGLGTLSVFAIPAQCTVTIDGFELGPNEMPLRNHRAVAGEHRIVFDWGTTRKEERVVLAAGGTQSVGGRRDQ